MSVGRIVVANGPNLNLQGSREPEIYGRTTLTEIEDAMRRRASAFGVEIVFKQSNHEGHLIDFLQAEAPGSRGVVINPGALSHYSHALYDCLRSLPVPVIEVHLSNVFARPEGFRRTSVTAAAAVGVISGLGARGYLFALEHFLDRDE